MKKNPVEELDYLANIATTEDAGKNEIEGTSTTQEVNFNLFEIKEAIKVDRQEYA